jgi:hypothetical protein
MAIMLSRRHISWEHCGADHQWRAMPVLPAAQRVPAWGCVHGFSFQFTGDKIIDS